jgi:hypothetical protein
MVNLPLRVTRAHVIALAGIIFVLWVGTLLAIPASTIINYVGISNAYAVAFLISLIAGFSAFTGGAAYATVIEFARGGTNPLYLGIASGIGIFLSDSFFYLVLRSGRDSLESRWPRLLARVHAWVERQPRIWIYTCIYLFSAFGPIPNDVILAALIIGGYEYRKFWPLLLAGDISFMLFLCYVFTSLKGIS